MAIKNSSKKGRGKKHETELLILGAILLRPGIKRSEIDGLLGKRITVTAINNHLRRLRKLKLIELIPGARYQPLENLLGNQVTDNNRIKLFEKAAVALKLPAEVARQWVITLGEFIPKIEAAHMLDIVIKMQDEEWERKLSKTKSARGKNDLLLKDLIIKIQGAHEMLIYVRAKLENPGANLLVLLLEEEGNLKAELSRLVNEVRTFIREKKVSSNYRFHALLCLNHIHAHSE